MNVVHPQLGVGHPPRVIHDKFRVRVSLHAEYGAQGLVHLGFVALGLGIPRS